MEENRQCLYCNQEVHDDQPYSLRAMNGIKRYWHYKCYVNNSKGMYELSESERKYLIGVVLEATGGNPDGLQLLALRAIGYGR